MTSSKWAYPTDAIGLGLMTELATLDMPTKFNVYRSIGCLVPGDVISIVHGINFDILNIYTKSVCGVSESLPLKIRGGPQNWGFWGQNGVKPFR